MVFGFFSSVALVVVGVVIGMVRLTRMWLESEDERVTRVISSVTELAKVAIAAMLLYALGPGIGAWLTDAGAAVLEVIV